MRATFLAEAGDVLASSLDYEITLKSAARLVVPILADWCDIQVFNDDGTLRRVTVVHWDPDRVRWANELGDRYPVDMDAPRGVGNVLRTGNPEVYSDIPDELLAAAARDPEHLEILRQVGMRSVMMVPLQARGRILGAISLIMAESDRRYSQEDIPFMEGLARRAAIAIDNARMHREMQEAVRVREEAVQLHRSIEDRLALLAEASSSLIETLDTGSVAPAVLALADRLIPADAYAIWRFQPVSNTWQIAASVGLSEEYKETLSQMKVVADAVLAGPVAIEDVERETPISNRLEAHQREGVKALLILPLQIRGGNSGTLVFYCRQPHSFSEMDIRIASALANMAASAIATAELYEVQSRARAEAETMQRRLAFLAQASSVLASSLDYQATLQQVVHLMVPYLADWCVVDLLEPGGQVRRVAAAHADPRKQSILDRMNEEYPMTRERQHPVLQVIDSSQPALYPELTDDVLAKWATNEEHIGYLKSLGLTTAIVVPVVIRGQTLGVVGLARAGTPYAWEDMTLAMEVSRSAAIAVENARLYEEVQESARRKDEFLAMLAHELRNPLAPILNAVHVLQGQASNNPAVQRTTAVVARQIDHMSRLVDDLLEASRITQGKITLRRRPVELMELVESAVQTVQPLLDAHHHHLDLALPAERVILNVDATRIEQVLVNLLNNAIKYTEPGGHIGITARTEPEHLYIAVRDTGIGIAPDLLPHVFDLFMQGDRSLDRSQGGLGIGLTLVRNLVEMHGGAVAVYSPGVGQGTEFEVRLPLRSAADQQDLWLTPARDMADSRERRTLQVLVVDDNVDAAETLADLLSLWGHQVSIAFDGPSALDAARRSIPDVVLLDIGLPGMDGFAVASALKQDPATREARLIALTGYGQEEDRQRCRETGFELHLTKPVDPEQLHRLLQY